MDPPPITEDQEWTLRQWASTVGKRPRKRDKAFLQAVKGLTDRQIDSWWNHSKQSKESENNMLPIPPTNAPEVSSNFEFQHLGETGNKHFEQDFPGRSESFLDMNFSDFSGGTFNFSPPLLQETDNWPSIGLTHQAFSRSYPAIPEVHQQPYQWPQNMSDQRGFLASEASMTDSSPLLSPLSTHRSYTANSDRSSYGSSLRTWDTSSTLASICDHYGDDHETTQDRSIDPSRPVRSSNSISEFTPKDTIAEEAPHQIFLKAIRVHPKAKSTANRISQESTRHLANGQDKYQCTACERRFIRKGDWKRHEEGHDPQMRWTCMLGEPAILSTSGWTCVFCNSFEQTRHEMVAHLMQEHRIQSCKRKGSEERTFTRKDKLKQHLQQVHSLSENSMVWKTWYEPVKKTKFAWGCGYCGCCSYTWEGRLTHLAEHYERPHIPLPRWSVSLVVKGLLRQQNCGDFKIFDVWKDLVGAAPNSDRTLEWPKETAMALKRRLEFHEGTTTEIATDAQRLALISNPSLAYVTWTSGDLGAATLSMPMKSTQTLQELSRTQIPSVLAQEDSEVQYIAGYI